MKENKSVFLLILTTLGIVYGDIGTSPLYVLKECFHPHYGLELNADNILGIISLIFYSLTSVIVIKYINFILKADNQGEGGPMALTSLLSPNGNYLKVPLIILFGLAATSLLIAEGIITPAISVLSAVEGLQIATPFFKPYVIFIALVLLAILFAFQYKGSDKVGKFFGPITLVWFITISLLGIYWIFQNPQVLHALNPWYAIKFFINNKLTGVLVLGSVMLCITGGEALYADMSHVGRDNIKKAWFWIVFPALVLNYFGQGALLLQHPEAIVNPFYNLVQGWLKYPLVLISTLATIVASQALITGTYSLAQQAIKLGFFPRLKVLYTSRENEGQIYIPYINWFLMIGCILLVLTMKESSNLAAAYGISVILTMTITSVMFSLLTYKKFNWPIYKSIALAIFLLTIDLTFLAGNLVKITHGGWITLTVAAVIFWLMISWKKGRIFLSENFKKKSLPLDEFIAQVSDENPNRVKGMGVYMTISKNLAPFVLLQNYKHNQVLHEKVLLLSIVIDNVPEVGWDKKVQLQPLTEGFYKVVVHYGFMENPKVMEILSYLQSQKGISFNFDNLSFYLGRESILTDGNSPMNIFSKKLFSLLNKNTQPITDFFQIPPERVIEIGGQVKI